MNAQHTGAPTPFTIVVGVASPGGPSRSGSEASRVDPVLAPALSLARALGARLHVVHVYEPPGFLLLDPAAADSREGGPDLLSRYADRMQESLEAMVAEQCRHLEGCTAHALEGSPSATLCHFAERLSADLLLVGTTRRPGRLGAFIGSTAERVARGSEIPVLLLRVPLTSGPGRIILATDLSAPSTHAIRVGAQLAERFHPAGVHLRALLVLNAQGTEEEGEGGAERARAEVQAQFEGAGLAPERFEVRIRAGEAAEEIAREVAEWPADLLVLGTIGRSGVSRLLFGSTASAAARRASCNVLVVPPARA